METIPESNLHFRALQQKLREEWQNDDVLEQDDHDIVVIPSFSIDQKVGEKIDGFLYYEERLLFSLIRLRNPHTRLIYITSKPLYPIIIDYYLQLLSGIPFSHARERLLLLNTYDNSFKPLTQKILERPRFVERIKHALRPNKSYMVCFNSTILEQELSLRLGIPLLASSPELAYWGSKSGSREIFAKCEIPHPDGSQLVFSFDELIREISELLTRKPYLNHVVIKLNEGFSGEGNAILDVTPINYLFIEEKDPNKKQHLISQIIDQASVQGKGETWQTFSSRISELGVIVEEFIEGNIKYSPSVQGYITPTGKVKILSTHDQILDKKNQQIFLGCRFPAETVYRLQLQELTLKIGQELAKKGAMERFGVDFLAVKNEQKWELYAIEINLRKGGTTHPFMTLKFLTNGTYNYQDGLFYTKSEMAKYYVASDNLQKPQYKGLLPNDLMDIIAKHHLHFDNTTKTGTIFHLMGALSEFGKVGLTSIGNSWAEAEAIYNHIEDVLDAETNSINQEKLSQNNLNPITW